MSKKLGFMLSGIMLVMAASTAFAANGMGGGQLDINGLIADNTCKARVDGDSKDGLILLQTAIATGATDGVLDTTVGAKARPFSITIDYGKADPVPSIAAKITFGSVFSGNSKGILNNDMSINTPPNGVDITLYNTEGFAIKQVRVNNLDDVYSRTLDSTSKSATCDLRVSYVRADANKVATAGYIKTNSTYTITYQ